MAAALAPGLAKEERGRGARFEGVYSFFFLQFYRVLEGFYGFTGVYRVFMVL